MSIFLICLGIAACLRRKYRLLFTVVELFPSILLSYMLGKSQEQKMSEKCESDRWSVSSRRERQEIRHFDKQPDKRQLLSTSSLPKTALSTEHAPKWEFLDMIIRLDKIK